MLTTGNTEQAIVWDGLLPAIMYDIMNEVAKCVDTTHFLRSLHSTFLQSRETEET